MLLAPRAVLSCVHHVEVDTTSLRVARILGARQLSQAVLSGVRPSPEVLAMGVWVDAVHAATAAGLAVADHARARVGIADLVVAGIWSAAGYHDLEHATATAPDHDRTRDTLARHVLGVVPGGRRLRRLADAARQGRP